MSNIVKELNTEVMIPTGRGAAGGGRGGGREGKMWRAPTAMMVMMM